MRALAAALLALCAAPVRADSSGGPLATDGGTGAPPGDAAVPVAPLAGPFPDLRAACARLRRDLCPDREDGPSSWRCPIATPAPLVEPPAPVREVKLTRARCTNRWKTRSETPLVVAVRLEAGWFVLAARGAESTDDADHGSATTTVEQLASYGGMVVLRWKTEGSSSRGTIDGTLKRRAIVVVGVGPSRRPSATAAITVAEHSWTEDHYNEPPRISRVDFERTVDPAAGVIRIGSTRPERDPDPEQLGEHALRFP